MSSAVDRQAAAEAAEREAMKDANRALFPLPHNPEFIDMIDVARSDAFDAGWRAGVRWAATRDEETDIGADVNRELTHKETEASLRQIIGELHADLDRRDATLRRIEHGCKEAAAMAPDPWRHMFVLAAQQVESALAAAPVSLPDEPKAERPFYKCAKCGDDSDDVSLGRRCPRCGAVPDERKD